MKDSTGLFGYRLLLYLLSPLLIALTIWQALPSRSWHYLWQRLGMAHSLRHDQPIWIHAASVGEVNAALPLITSLRNSHPDIPILLSTSTLTGGHVARSKLPADVEQCFLPVDWPGNVRRFLSRRAPRCALIMETELWPNLYAALYRNQIPLLIINGRLSAKTLKAPKWLRILYKGCLKRCHAILARSEQDRTGFIALGATPEHVSVVGNIKFSSTATETVSPLPELKRNYVLAASTRDEEEALIVKAWLSAERGEHLLVIAPRHPKRVHDILTQLDPLLSGIAVRSRGDEITAETKLYVADTFGELPALMSGAELVFMGGSLVDRGGQNLLEPAALGKPVITGAHMENFTDETRLLLEHEALLQVHDQDELGKVFTDLLKDPERRKTMGENAYAVITAHQEMAQKYLSRIEELCNLRQ